MSDGLITCRELELAVGPAMYARAFDDGGENAATTEAVELCIRICSATVESYILENYPDYVRAAEVEDVPLILKAACFDYCRLWIAQRVPEVYKALSETPWTELEKSAIATMTRYRKSEQRMADAEAGHPEVVDEGAHIVTDTSRWGL